MKNPTHAAHSTEKIREQNPDFFFLDFSCSVGNIISYNAGIILKISHNCGADKRTETLFEISFFCLIHILLPNYF